MSHDMKLMRKLGVTPKALKSAFTAKKPSKEIEAITERIKNRIKEAVDFNTNSTNYRIFAAIDRSLDSPFFQTSYSLFQGMLKGDKWDSKKVNQVVGKLKEWGAGNWIRNTCGCGNCGSDCSNCKSPNQTIDIPTFFEIDFPIALAYLRIRVARMYNDRNLTPLFPYYPMVNTPEERMRCQILTHRIQVQANQMNYKAILRQMIHQSTAYGSCILFPKEAWHFEQRPLDEMEEQTDKRKKKKRKLRTEREGIRYDHPHPCRMYWDLAHPAYTLNSDTGCQYTGYWSLVRFRDVEDNPDYWNTKDIRFGKDSFRITDNNRLFFEMIYPCSMEFPMSKDTENATDREDLMQKYTREERDKAMLLSNHFEKLNPLKDLGLKNDDGEGYDANVWFRFTVGGDETIIHAEPLAYRPTIWSGYDADANRARNPSIVLEAVPAQDMIHNLFSQAILQAKNNLANINFVNTDAIGQEYIDQIENFGEKVYRRPIFIQFSQHESRAVSDEKREAIIPVPIQRMPINDLLVLVKGILDLVERTLVMSAQEIASSASHEQSATEVVQVAQSTSTRLTYTGSYIDDAIYAWQVQLHDAGMAYWDDEMVAQVAMQEEADKKTLEELGFKIEGENDTERTAGVRGSKKTLDVTQFTVRRDAADRIQNTRVAAQMVQLFQAFGANPLLLQAIGTGQIVKVFNEIANMAGLPRDFRLTAINDPIKEAKKMALEDREMAKEDRDDAKKMAEKQQAQQTSGEIQKLLAQMQEQIMGEVGNQLKPVFEQAAEVDKQQQQQIEQIGGITQQNATITQELQSAVGKMAQILTAGLQPPQPELLPPVPMG